MKLELAGLWEPAEGMLSSWGAQLLHMLIAPGSKFSLLAIACSLLIAALFLLARRPGERPVPVRVLLRALFPRRLWRSRSGRADLAFSFFNIFLAALLFGWALISAEQVSRLVEAALAGASGAPQPARLPAGVSIALTTLALYLAFELAYWLDHLLSHKIPFLWQFHMVHHSAETLSPLTNFRVHPVDSVVFYNIVALCLGLTQGLLNHGFATPASGFTIGGSTVILLAAGFTLTHLQHSHLWISFSGPLGRLILSPAHHQIHQSADPRHFDRNFGSSLALWDWLFGTLHLPSREREKLNFGVPAPGYDPHSAPAALAMPFVKAARLIRREPSIPRSVNWAAVKRTS